MSRTMRVVGNFYLGLACHLFDGEPLSVRDENGDFFSKSIDAWGEVKASSNSKAWRLATSQLDYYADQQANRLYTLFGYKNAWNIGGKRLKPLARLSREETNPFLAYYTSMLYVFDLDVMLAIWRKQGDRTDRFVGDRRHESVVEVNRTFLAQFSPLRAQAMLRSLKLNPRRYSVQEQYLTTQFLGEELNFPVTAVIKLEMRDAFNATLSRITMPHIQTVRSYLRRRPFLQ